MRQISEIFEDIRRYLKERRQNHDNDFWERQAHFDHLEGIINAELDIKIIMSWLENGMRKFKGTIPYLSNQRYYNYLAELKEILNGKDPTIAILLNALPSEQVSHALVVALHTEKKFAEALLLRVLDQPEVLQKIFISAIQQHNLQVIKMLLQYKVDVSEEVYFAAKKTDNEQIYQLIVQPYHRSKKQLLMLGPVLLQNESVKDRPTIADALLSRTFAETTAKKAMLRKNITEIARQPLLQDVLAVAALAALSKHDQGRERNKQLVIILAEDLKSYVALNRDVMGLYNNKNSVYVMSKHEQAIVPILAHEITHFVASEIFKNDSNPYQRDDIRNEQIFSEIVAESKAMLTKLPKDDVVMRLAAVAFEEVYEDYTAKKQALELIVRVPQVVALFGNDKAVKWLNTYFPKLLDYYEKVFVPACKQYLVEHHADQYLNLSGKPIVLNSKLS